MFGEYRRAADEVEVLVFFDRFCCMKTVLVNTCVKIEECEQGGKMDQINLTQEHRMRNSKREKDTMVMSPTVRNYL